jgi:hypothetical protein
MNTQLTTQSKAVIQCVNKTIADDFIRRYQSSTKNALENILCMGEAVNEIYQKVKSKELDQSDLEYFCQSVHLDPKGSTFRKYKAIGENANRFRQYLEKLPSTFSVLYEMSTLEQDDFERYVARSTFSKEMTLEQFKKIVNQTTKLKRSNLYVQPVIKTPRLSIARELRKANLFEIFVVRDLEESKFDQVVDALTEFKNKGWINFEVPEITQYENKSEENLEIIDDDEKYFKVLADQDALEMRM